jgi:hypothetical protein
MRRWRPGREVAAEVVEVGPVTQACFEPRLRREVQHLQALGEEVSALAHWSAARRT